MDPLEKFVQSKISRVNKNAYGAFGFVGPRARNLDEARRVAEETWPGVYLVTDEGRFFKVQLHSPEGPVKWIKKGSYPNPRHRRMGNPAGPGEESYNVYRFFKRGRRKLILKGVSLAVAQLHCRDPRTSKKGVYFDGYIKNPLNAREIVERLGDARAYRDMALKEPKGSFERVWFSGRGNGIAQAVYDSTKDRTAKINAVSIAEQTMRVAKGARPNPPGSRLIGCKVTHIGTSQGSITLRGTCPIYGLKDGSVFIRGFFTKVPGGYVKHIEYMDEEKAKREGLKNPGLPWRHDFTRERRPLQKVKGGLLIKRGKLPLWGMR